MGALDDVNSHFHKVRFIRKAFSYMDALTIDDVFKTVILATLKASGNSALGDANRKLLTPPPAGLQALPVDAFDDFFFLQAARVRGASWHNHPHMHLAVARGM